MLNKNWTIVMSNTPKFKITFFPNLQLKYLSYSSQIEIKLSLWYTMDTALTKSGQIIFLVFHKDGKQTKQRD